MFGSGGDVATSTTNRPLSSSSFFITGVVAFQLWLFCPSMMTTRIFLLAPAVAVEASTVRTAAAARMPTQFNRLDIARNLSAWRDAQGERAIRHPQLYKPQGESASPLTPTPLPRGERGRGEGTRRLALGLGELIAAVPVVT